MNRSIKLTVFHFSYSKRRRSVNERQFIFERFQSSHEKSFFIDEYDSKSAKYVIVQRNNLDKIIVIAKKIEKKRDVVIIEQNEIIRELNETKTIIRFLQNDLTKQQN